jgi:male-specific lethal 3
MPSLVYGPIHLLRLFVKLPELLQRMNMPPKTCKLIVKYMDAVLEYFEGRPDLFSAQMYEK